ncbi:MAG: hypothetical protein A2231_12605 [Candidatus Firestonebacteria bacterium RIFOXYA2_FULL_40_8]|nr:MAG: hypothetical protein A2231_12605 [Candidatus Firestonebacteria bacterium RIFOXYA2_FULL_40_8]
MNNVKWNDIDAVIFDMDGVLTDSEPLINEAAITALKEYGVSAKEEDFLPFVGAGDEKYIAGVAEKYGLKYKSEMKARMYELYFELLPKKIKSFPGVKELLSALKKAGKKIAVASSADRIKVEANLNGIGLALSVFDQVVTGDDITRKKPDPEIFLIAAKKLNIPPEKCCVIEDAVNGVEASKAAGMKCIAITNSFSSEKLSEKNPDRIVNSLLEIRTTFIE